MTDTPETDDHLTRFVRGFMQDVRNETENREETDVVDRVLAAASFVIAALLIIWPKDRKGPWIFAALSQLGQQIWKRRGWFMP